MSDIDWLKNVVRLAYIGTDEDREKLPNSILDWHLAEIERVIGSDETSEDEITNDLFYATRNGLRQKQRERAGL